MANGIINFSTYEGNLAGFQLNPNAIVIEYNGLQLKREFYAPAYESNEQVNNRVPDKRNVLFWEPAIRSNDRGKNEVSFYTSDVPGHYVIIIQGISKSGLAGSGSSTITIKN